MEQARPFWPLKKRFNNPESGERGTAGSSEQNPVSNSIVKIVMNFIIEYRPGASFIVPNSLSFLPLPLSLSSIYEGQSSKQRLHLKPLLRLSDTGITSTWGSTLQELPNL